MQKKQDIHISKLSYDNEKEPVLHRKAFLNQAMKYGAIAFGGMTFYQCVTTATGKKEFILLPESEETAMGEDAYRDILAEEKISSNQTQTTILRESGQRIAAVSHRPDYKWEFNLLDNQSVNAFCLPGGKIAFYEGIMPYCQNEAGLAIVMGHEVGHATSRHAAQRISQSMVTQFGIAAVDATMAKNSQYRDVILGGLGVGATVGVMLPYSREHEYEADALGLEYMAKAGYDPAHGIEFWDRFAQLDHGGGSDFLSTHPLTSKRLQRMKDQLPTARKLYNAAPNRYGAGRALV